MRKLLICLSMITPLSGCSSIDIDSDSWDLFGDVIPHSLERLPFVYRPLIVQGNVITQESVNKLKPGMTRKQVEFSLGTPLLRDIFHDNRWDYYYGIGIGSLELEKHVSLFFENDQLVRITGDYQPQSPAQGEGIPDPVDPVVVVPDWDPPRKTLYDQVMGTVGLDKKETPANAP